MQTGFSYLRFEVITSANMSYFTFWAVASCGLAARYESYGGNILPVPLELKFRVHKFTEL